MVLSRRGVVYSVPSFSFGRKYMVILIKFKFMSLIRLLFLLALVGVFTPAHARGTYQEPADFLSEVFQGDVPEPNIIWLKDGLKEQVEEILSHRYKGRRIRYWHKENRIVWILEEVGKKKPITTGIVINSGRIEKIKVLIFRESRGWEVRYPFFTKQYIDSGLKAGNKLDKTIDGISGATLSVRALTKLARIALLLSKQITQNVTK